MSAITSGQLRYDFGPGYATTRGTVQLLADAARAYHTNRRIVDRARSIVAGLPSMDVDAEIRAVWEFIITNVRYVRDPLFAEYITAPDYLDAAVDAGTAQEDCEGIALYAATLLAAIGIPSEFEIQGRDPSKPQRFTHCALRVQNPRTKQWISFDPIGYWESERGTIAPGFDLGDTLHRDGDPVERFNLAGEKSLDGGLLGALFGDAQSVLNTVEQNNSTIDQVASVLPYGPLLDLAVHGGEAIAQSQIHSSAASSAPSSSSSSSSGGTRRTTMLNVNPSLLRPAVSAAVGGRALSTNAPEWVKPLAIAGALLLGAKLFGVV